jgi:hypothetical protein
MLGHFKREGYKNLFFESGSTLSFISDEFEKIIRDSYDNTDWKITTNNAMVLLQYLLHTHIDVIPKPARAPVDRYGAMLNDVLVRANENFPSFPRSLFPAEKAAVEKTKMTLQENEKTKRIYLTTASGLDMENENLTFRGPHVGSHPNMLFKRAIFEIRQPKVLFLDISKFEKAFMIGQCFPVFNLDFKWQDVSKKCMLAICVGLHFKKEEGETKKWGPVEKLAKELKTQLGDLDTDYARTEYSDGGVAIFANTLFKNIFKKE